MYEELSFEPEPFEDFQVFDELRSEWIPANRQKQITQERTQETTMHDQLSFEAEPLNIFRSRREEEVIPPVDTRTCIRATTAAPFRYICSIQTPINPTTMRVGSGTLIGPRTVLTAGHNMDGVSAALTQVAPGRIGPAATPFGISVAALFVFAPGFVASSATDYGVIVLRNPLGNSANWWTFNPFKWPGDSVGTSVLQGSAPAVAAGTRVSLSGYPADLPAATHLGGRRDPCFVSGSNLAAQHQYIDTNRATRVTPLGLLEYENDTFGGNSGSPVWHEIDRASGRTLLAVHISGDSTAEFPDVNNRGVFIRPSVLEFVRAHSFFPPSAPPVGSAGRPTIRMKSKGLAVVELQYRLNIWLAVTPSAGLPQLKVDGDFGPKTSAASKAFQRAMRLLVDGIVGPITWNRLLLPF
jgi:glutamyl endopeptidase